MEHQNESIEQSKGVERPSEVIEDKIEDLAIEEKVEEEQWEVACHLLEHSWAIMDQPTLILFVLPNNTYLN